MSDVVLAEPAARAKLVVGGRRMREALTAAQLPFDAGRVAAAAAGEVWALSGAEALLVLAPGGDAARSGERLRAAGAAVTDVGAGLVELGLLGAGTRRLLEGVCPVDLGADAVADGAIVHLPMAGVRVTLARQDRDGGPRFTILVARELSEWLRDTLLDAGASRP